MKFVEVNPDDFSKITLERLPHQEIESTLIGIGGNGTDGIQYKTQVLKAAGWKYERLTTYASHPDVAAEAFNRVREILARTDNKDEILDLLAA